jgi:hypothetical protein
LPARRCAPRRDRGANSFATSVIDERTAALVRVAATIAVDAAPSSFQHAVAFALWKAQSLACVVLAGM